MVQILTTKYELLVKSSTAKGEPLEDNITAMTSFTKDCALWRRNEFPLPGGCNLPFDE
jgi:hypothetical protein